MTQTEATDHPAPAYEPHVSGHEAEAEATAASNPFGDTAEAPSIPSTAAAPSPPPSHNDDGPTLPPRANEPPLPPRTEPAGDALGQEPAVDPRVASLQPMFPDFEPMILQSVLESVGWDQDRAVDTLLGMNDPSYVPQQQAPVAPPPSQTDLDEQLARRLMLEEEQQAAARHRWAPSSQPRGQGQPQGLPQGEWGPPPGGQGQGQGQGQRDTMAEFQDQFNKVAEVGKKTFSSIVSKVKAKMQELDQSMQNPSQSSSTTPSWGGTGNDASTYQPQPGQAAPDRHAQAAYYAPNPYANQAQGYDVTPNMTPQREVPPSTTAGAPSAGAGPPPSTATGAPTMGTSPAPPISPPAHGDTPPPPFTQRGPPTPSIDPSKIGLLPRRSISLVRDQQSTSRPKDDDDELEYVENPFEQRK